MIRVEILFFQKLETTKPKEKQQSQGDCVSLMLLLRVAAFLTVYFWE